MYSGKIVVLVAFLAIGYAGCRTVVKQVPPGQTDSLQDQLFHVIVESIESHNEYPTQISHSTVSYALIRNKTSFHLDTGYLGNLVLSKFKKRLNIRIVAKDDQTLKYIREEWSRIQLGEINPDEVKRIGILLGTDFFLIGDLISEFTPSLNSDIRIFFVNLRLISSNSGEVVWNFFGRFQQKGGEVSGNS